MLRSAVKQLLSKEAGADKRVRQKARARKVARKVMRLVIPAVAGGRKVARKVAGKVARKVATKVARQVATIERPSDDIGVAPTVVEGHACVGTSCFLIGKPVVTGTSVAMRFN